MRLAGIRIAPELVNRIVADTDSGESLPLLAYTLQQITRPMLVDSPTVDLSSRAKEFLTNSDRRNQQRRRQTTITVAVVLITSLIPSIIAVWQWQEAVNQQRIATARELIARAEQLRSGNIRQALKLGLAAKQLDSNPNTLASLATTLTGTMLTSTIPDPDKRIVRAVAFSRDGHTLATSTPMPCSSA